jgi:hypothetical protein
MTEEVYECPNCGTLCKNAFCYKCGTRVIPEEPPAKEFCPKCGGKLEAGALFCGSCGYRITAREERACPKCGAKTTGEFCDVCGSRLAASGAELRQGETDTPEEQTIDEILAELNAEAVVKESLHKIVNEIAILKKIEARSGKPALTFSNHMVITGKPDADYMPIVVAIAKLFKAAGALATDEVISVYGWDLKGAYIGQSGEKIIEYCQKAIGGILFVDEANCLANEQGPVDMFAKEASDMLIARLENDRDKFVCIVTGPYDEMNNFLDKLNPGMRRRFKHFINLSD